MIAVDARSEAIAAYRARKAVLLEEAGEAERSRRPITAARKRQSARLLSMAIVSEELDSLPTGIVREEVE